MSKPAQNTFKTKIVLPIAVEPNPSGFQTSFDQVELVAATGIGSNSFDQVELVAAIEIGSNSFDQVE